MVLAVAALALAVLIGTTTGDRGWLEAKRRAAAHEELAREVEQLKERNAALLSDIRALRTDPYVIEKLAREKLGYAKPGEVIYLFPPGEPPEVTPPPGT